jgi:hypothetical protein
LSIVRSSVVPERGQAPMMTGRSGWSANFDNWRFSALKRHYGIARQRSQAPRMKVLYFDPKFLTPRDAAPDFACVRAPKPTIGRPIVGRRVRSDGAVTLAFGL